MKFKWLLFFFGMLVGSFSLSAQEINQFDIEGKRHGVWKKYFPKSQQLRYQGTFEHGKEVGAFKFYCEKCKDKPNAVKAFTANSSIVTVQYFTIKGKLVSEGQMDGKNRIGEWVYYQKKSKEIMTREYYENGKLDGLKTVYYPNGKITEELHYKNGLKEGENLYYSLNGVLLKKLQYVNDELQGVAVYYDANGEIIIEGAYKKGKKHGLWKYYKGGKLVTEETYPKPLRKVPN